MGDGGLSRESHPVTGELIDSTSPRSSTSLGASVEIGRRALINFDLAFRGTAETL